ncbi:hypothetical protein SAMN04488090_0413 [Siphonobacter aquaeclarae]|jgi:hypothetical protein|uniref:YdhG-like domain-containing protein n=2 Tax=Siphonobacter aquaeclarae TaxID=563176 RepID=A0A1G9IBP3_9BACT|nr:hypothetical protein SAMN04488090_0413 [Siphonobacter aquaeclarae]
MREMDRYFLEQEEPVRSCMLFLREYILGKDPAITEAWKYRMPFFCFRGKMFCYLWTDRKTSLPYIGVVEGKRVDHPGLLLEKRARMRIFPVDPRKDLVVEDLDILFDKILALYRP